MLSGTVNRNNKSILVQENGKPQEGIVSTVATLRLPAVGDLF